MIKYFVLIVLTLLLVSCSETVKKSADDDGVDTKQFEAERPLVVEDEDGKYTEWYEGHKQVKIKGRKDKKGRKVGIWKYYTKRGVEQSITEYKKGIKDGHTIVRHKNGAIYYKGEYEMDEPTGVWKFYNEEGQLVERKFYDEE